MAERRAAIKKYGDRRLYDSSAGRYVNLAEIAAMIREGVEVQVVEARSGKDVTRVVLTQIIMEHTRDGETDLPLKLLHQLVVASDRATHEFLSWYLETAFELYQRAKAALLSPVEFVRSLLRNDPGEIEELRRQVAELKARLARREPHASRRKDRTGLR